MNLWERNTASSQIGSEQNYGPHWTTNYSKLWVCKRVRSEVRGCFCSGAQPHCYSHRYSYLPRTIPISIRSIWLIVKFILYFIFGKTLIGMKRYVFTVYDGEAWPHAASQSFNEYQIAFLCHLQIISIIFVHSSPHPRLTFVCPTNPSASVQNPLKRIFAFVCDDTQFGASCCRHDDTAHAVCRGVKRATIRIAWLTHVDHVIHVVFCHRTNIDHIMHGFVSPEMTFYLEGLTNNRCDHHFVPIPALSLLRLGNVAVGLLRHVCQINSQPIHVTFVPIVTDCTLCAIVVA